VTAGQPVRVRVSPFAPDRSGVASFLEDFGKGIAELLSKHGLTVLLLPHDLGRVGAKAKSDVAIAMELASILKAQSAAGFYSIFIPSTADQVKRLAGKGQAKRIL